MYSKIVNPKTNRKVNISSKLGKNILKNYYSILKYGGTWRDGQEPKPSKNIKKMIKDSEANDMEKLRQSKIKRENATLQTDEHKAPSQAQEHKVSHPPRLTRKNLKPIVSEKKVSSKTGKVLKIMPEIPESHTIVRSRSGKKETILIDDDSPKLIYDPYSVMDFKRKGPNKTPSANLFDEGIILEELVKKRAEERERKIEQNPNLDWDWDTERWARHQQEARENLERQRYQGFTVNEVGHSPGDIEMKTIKNKDSSHRFREK
tara:strand:+ start:4934 stop:5719 length:786 start_codon:yes stop_codon:yes gene_type:complete